MARPKRLRPLLTIRSICSVALVLALSGLLFATSARLARGDRSPGDLAQLLKAESQRTDQLDALVGDMTAQIDDLRAAAAPVNEPNLSTAVGVAVGTVPLAGAGVTVSLDDAPVGTPFPKGDPALANWLVVHQGDVQAVVNALWSGGAEAMLLQGQRVTPTSAFRCVGNTLLLHGRVFSPPYVIQAVGDPAALDSGLSASPAVEAFRMDAVRYGVRWSSVVSDHLDIPAFEGSLELKYARPLAKES